MAVRSRDITMQVAIGSIHVYACAEDCSWQPDVADDLHNRVMKMLGEAVLIAAEYGMIEATPDADEVEAIVLDNGELNG